MVSGYLDSQESARGCSDAHDGGRPPRCSITFPSSPRHGDWVTSHRVDNVADPAFRDALERSHPWRKFRLSRVQVTRIQRPQVNVDFNDASNLAT